MDILLSNTSSTKLEDAQAVGSCPRSSYTRADRAGEDWSGITDPTSRKKIAEQVESMCST
jgi:hypothetical protein